MQWMAADEADKDRIMLTMTGFSKMGRRRWMMDVPRAKLTAIFWPFAIKAQGACTCTCACACSARIEGGPYLSAPWTLDAGHWMQPGECVVGACTGACIFCLGRHKLV